jgi:hypothetical protein
MSGWLAEDDEQVALAGGLQVLGHVQVSVHACLEHRDRYVVGLLHGVRSAWFPPPKAISSVLRSSIAGNGERERTGGDFVAPRRSPGMTVSSA